MTQRERDVDQFLLALLGRAPSPGEPIDRATLNLAAGSLGTALVRRLLEGSPRPDRLTVASPQPSGELPVRFLILEEFLAPSEVASLLRYAEQREIEFTTSRVISATTEAGVVDYAHRRSRLHFDIGAHRGMMVGRLLSCLPLVLDKLGHAAFDIARFEVQMTTSNDGDYFKVHNDNTHPALVGRELTFVYFFHREPRAFEGGGLRLYNSRWDGTRYVATDVYRTIIPEQNQVVFFPSFFMHEILPVRCPSKAFLDGRFTLNGWIHKTASRPQ